MNMSFYSILGVGRHLCRPKVAGLFEIIPKYGTGPQALVPEKEIFAGQQASLGLKTSSPFYFE